MRTVVLRRALYVVALAALVAVGIKSARPLFASNVLPVPGDLYDSTCTEQQQPDDTRKDVLVIGDSISVGYTPFLRSGSPDFDFVHPSCNTTTSINGVTTINQWLALRPQWEVAIFNHGLWDIVPFYNVSVDAYKSALMVEGLQLKRSAKRVFFVTTTFVPKNSPNRSNRNVAAYNSAAKVVMNEIGVPVIDLYRLSKSVHKTDAAGVADVHYTSEGYRRLADYITDRIH